MEAYHNGLIANISLSGCFFPSETDLPVGEQCDVTITTGEGLEVEEVTINGTIVRNSLEGVGINFTDTSPENKLHLEKIISQNSAE